MHKPRQSHAGLWNISFGFFGIQIGFALQNANVSRIFQSLGTSIDNLPILWIAGPITGMLVQPLIGHFSDRTWSARLGRRRPYFLGGALLATAALLGMPNAPVLWVAAALLWLLDASLNISMEPFRAFVGDMVPDSQTTAGYAFQTAFIGAGAVAASLAPSVLTNVFGVSHLAGPGEIPPSVRLAFYLGAAALLGAVLWTVLSVREYSPAELQAFDAGATAEPPPLPGHSAIGRAARAPWWIGAGLAVVAAVAAFGLDKPVYILGGMLIAFGAAQLLAARLAALGRGDNILCQLLADLAAMPPTMRKLCLVQFFTWSALFIMWIYTTPVVTARVFGALDPTSEAYNTGADWVGVMFAVYSGVAALYAFVLPRVARRIGRRATHIIGLLCGAAGFASFLVIRDANLLLGAMVLIGIAWASILTMPYAILASTLPQAKLGVYMGIFNIFIVLPQLIVSSAMGAVVKAFFPHDPVYAMAVAAAVLVAAAAAMLRVGEG